MALTEVGRWLSGAGEIIWDVKSDGTFVYGAMEATFIGMTGIVLKINQATMLEVARWTGAPGEDRARALCYDGTFLYVALSGTSPAVVIKLNPATMLEVARWTAGPFAETGAKCLDYDGTYLYVGLGVTPGILIQIDPVTMLEVARWTGAAWEKNCVAITHDGTWVYLALSIASDGLVIQIDPATMLENARFFGAGHEYAYVQRSVYAAGFVYITVKGSGAGTTTKIIKIDTTTMAEVGAFAIPDTNHALVGITFQGDLYAYQGDPGGA